jgi:hypothetical protein
MPCSKEKLVTSVIVSAIIYLMAVTITATSHDDGNAFNILALISASVVLLVHTLATCGMFIVNVQEDGLGEWPTCMHRLALVPASCFVMFSPGGAGVDPWLRYVASLLGILMFWEHTVGLYGRETQRDGKGFLYG